jgi:hypothetical protein
MVNNIEEKTKVTTAVIVAKTSFNFLLLIDDKKLLIEYGCDRLQEINQEKNFILEESETPNFFGTFDWVRVEAEKIDFNTQDDVIIDCIMEDLDFFISNYEDEYIDKNDINKIIVLSKCIIPKMHNNYITKIKTGGVHIEIEDIYTGQTLIIYASYQGNGKYQIFIDEDKKVKVKNKNFVYYYCLNEFSNESEFKS